ncbi:SAM-dependent methyltransferase [Thermococcus profundus]|uniref:SAM-dependent methyltransferase n=1 Tax=Thermococcus profundus TaxID=49899 RepID=A0A2Z2MBI6_THEPR|nr:class I SAM-dependent methyltransferase [Thermococcus profundus]ASJ02863.1 SAM-dependent methyltransferase [Thermococcus profundus]
MASLEELYSWIKWPMDPGDERAQKRFLAAKAFFNWAVKENMLPDRRKIRILDLCAGTGLAGAALAEVLMEWGREVKLTLVDKRKEDLLKAEGWLDGLEVEVYGAVMDCMENLRKLGTFDVALLWGLTMPHFDPFQTADLFRNIAKTLEGDGVFMLEETDRIHRIFYRGAYQKMLMESRTEDSEIVSIDAGYNVKRGTIRRIYYRLPGFERLGEVEHRYWDLAGLAGIGKALFREARIITPGEHSIAHVSDVIYLREPIPRV